MQHLFQDKIGWANAVIEMHVVTYIRMGELHINFEWVR